MKRTPESEKPPTQYRVEAEATNIYSTSKKEVGTLSDAHDFLAMDFTVPLQTWKGNHTYQDQEELMPNEGTIKRCDNSLEDSGFTSFHEASHPPEPVDTDLMKPVYVPIGSNKVDGKCLVKNMSLKGPSLDDISIQVLNMKPSSFLLSPAEIWAENPNDLGVVSSPFMVRRPSQNTLASLPPDSEEKECLWDASLSTSSNVSPHSSIDSYGVGTAMSIPKIYTSTYRSDELMSESLRIMDRNCGSTKLIIQGDSLESAKTSFSRASDSSELSDDSNWSNITGSANKPHRGSDPRCKAILSVGLIPLRETTQQGKTKKLAAENRN